MTQIPWCEDDFRVSWNCTRFEKTVHCAYYTHLSERVTGGDAMSIKKNKKGQVTHGVKKGYVDRETILYDALHTPAIKA